MRKETDEEVRANLEPSEVPLFNRFRTWIHGSERQSRTEAFRQYLEDHPGEQNEAIDRVAGLELDAIMRPMLDFYETPGWATRAIIPILRDRHGMIRHRNRILDAGCGTGAILRELIRTPYVREVMPHRPEVTFLGVEKEAGRFAECEREGLPVRHGDFFLCQDEDQFDVIVSNPPYSYAIEFVQHAITLAPLVCMLLRLNWVASQWRAPWHRENPAHIHVLPRRPSFTNDGKTDATEYAWFVWDRGWPGGKWEILNVEKAPKRGKR